jgi:hypothetical protein
MAVFSKKHYQATAEILRVHRNRAVNHGANYATDTNEALDTIDELTGEFADTFARDNPAFNREHFLAVVRGERAVTSRPPKGVA